MVQPKTPPLSIRLPPAMLERVDQVSASTGETRHATIIALVSLGLQQSLILQDVKVRMAPERGEPDGWTAGAQWPAEVLGETARKPGKVPINRIAERFQGVTATGEPLPQRGAYQKGAGKKR